MKQPDVKPQEDSFKYTPVTAEDLRKNHQALKMLCLVGGMIVLLLAGLIIIAAMSLFGPKSNVTHNKATNQTKTAETKQTAYQSDSMAPADTIKLLTTESVGQGQIPDHYRGNKDAKVSVIEYGDFTCPYCQDLHAEASKIQDEFKDKALFIYRNYNVGHTYSDITLRAAEAAYLVGGEDAYWAMSDELYSADEWVNGTYMETAQVDQILGSYASKIGLNVTDFQNARAASAANGIDAKIARDRDLARESDVSGTPTWIINGRSVRPSASNIRNELTSLAN